MSPLKLCWSSSKKNFGDWLSPVICGHLSGRPVVHADPERCDLIAIGSVLSRVKEGWFRKRIHVWGSGYIEAQPPKTSKHFYHAVRGHQTAALLKDIRVEAVGDPGLLCDLIYPEFATVKKDYALGLVPHYKDAGHPIVAQLEATFPGIKVLNVFSDTREFLRDLASCEFVISSSLHGLIASDSFGIPNAWAKMSDAVKGADFKFRDYYSVFGIENPTPLVLKPELSPKDVEPLARGYKRPGIEAIKKGLIESFPFPRS